jgi:hypothetical protein
MNCLDRWSWSSQYETLGSAVRWFMNCTLRKFCDFHRRTVGFASSCPVCFVVQHREMCLVWCSFWKYATVTKLTVILPLCGTSSEERLIEWWAEGGHGAVAEPSWWCPCAGRMVAVDRGRLPWSINCTVSTPLSRQFGQSVVPPTTDLEIWKDTSLSTLKYMITAFEVIRRDQNCAE